MTALNGSRLNDGFHSIYKYNQDTGQVEKLIETALIRITSDLLIKFLWCLQGANDKEIEERIVRWEQTTFKEQKRFLSELKEVASDTEKKIYEKGIDDLDKKINNGVKGMRNTRQIFKECKSMFSSVDIYAKAYQQYNHPSE